MKSFILKEALYDKRFKSKKYSGRAYAAASKKYLSERVIRRTTKKERIALMILAERLEIHPMVLINEGLWDSFKELVGIKNKAAKATMKDPKATEKEERIAKELERLNKQNYGLSKRWQANKEADGTWWQGVKHSLGALPNLFVQGQHVIPGTKQGNKLRAKANVAFEDLKKQLDIEFGNIFKKLVAGLKELGEPTTGGFPNNPNSRDFLKVMYGTPFFEDLTPDELGGLAGKMLEIRASLEDAVKSGVLDNDYANKIMQKGVKILEYYMGSMEENYLSTLENKGQNNRQNLIRGGSRYSLTDSMTGSEYWLNRFLTEKNEPNNPKSRYGDAGPPPKPPAMVELPSAEGAVKEQEKLQSQVESELQSEGGMSEEELKDLFGDNPRARIAKIAAGLATGELGDDLDPRILEKTDLSANAKKFIIMAAVGAALAAIGYALGGSFGIDKVYGQIQDAMADKWEDLDLRQSIEVAKEETIKGTMTELKEAGSSIHPKDGVSQLSAREFNMPQDQVDNMGNAEWWKRFKAIHGDSPEAMKASFGDRMNDPETFFKQMEAQSTANPDQAIKDTFQSDQLGQGRDGKAPFSLFTGDIKTFVTKQVETQMTKYVVKQVGAVMWTKVSGMGLAGAIGVSLPSILVTVGVSTAVAAGTIAALRKFKNSRGKQLKGLIDIVSKPIDVPFGTKKVLKAQEKIGIDPVVPPNKIPKEDIQSPTEEYRNSLALVYQAMQKKGYKKDDAMKLWDELFSEENPFEMARTELTADKTQQTQMFAHANPYSLMPLLTEDQDPAYLLMEKPNKKKGSKVKPSTLSLAGAMENPADEPVKLKYSKFAKYMSKGAKKAGVPKPNKDQVEAAAWAFNIASGIGDIGDLPDGVAAKEELAKLKKLRKKLKSKNKKQKKTINKLNKDYKKKLKKHKGKSKDYEEMYEAQKGKVGDLSGQLAQMQKDLEQGKIDAEMAQKIREDLENQVKIATESESERKAYLHNRLSHMQQNYEQLRNEYEAKTGKVLDLENELKDKDSTFANLNKAIGDLGLDQERFTDFISGGGEFANIRDYINDPESFGPKTDDSEKDDKIKELEEKIAQMVGDITKTQGDLGDSEKTLTDLGEIYKAIGAAGDWKPLEFDDRVEMGVPPEDADGYYPNFFDRLHKAGVELSDSENPGAKKVGNLLKQIHHDGDYTRKGEAGKVEMLDKKETEELRNTPKEAAWHKGDLLNESIDRHTSIVLSRWQKLAGLE